MTLALVGAAVFLAAVAYDYAYARYLTARRRFTASNWSVTVYLIGIVGTLSLLKISTWLLIPEVAGLWLGTALGWRPRCECTCERCGL